jgi:tetratricopeptide (TPR) repeat protein
LNRHVRWLALLLAAVAVAAYVNSFHNPFVFDDDEAIVTNASIRHLSPIGDVLAPPSNNPTAGRPLVNLTFAINYALSGFSTTGFRATNLLIHLAGALLLLGIVRRTLLRHPDVASGVDAAWAGFAAALLWLLHPLQTETIDYITQRTESLAGLFVLLTVYAAMRGMAAKRPARWYVLAVCASVLGVASKESAVVAPVLVLLYDAAFESGGLVAALRRRVGLYGALAASWAVLAYLALPGPRARTAGFAAGVSPWTYLLNQAVMIVRYLRLAIWPAGLVADYGPVHPIAFGQALPYLLVVLALAGGALVAWWKRPAVGYVCAWFFVTLAPTSSLVPIASEVGAERRMYLPLAALAVLAAIAAAKLARQARAATAVVAIVAVALGAATFHRNSEYASRIGLWQTVLARAPQGRVHFNLGAELAAEGRHDEAIREYRLGLTDSYEAQLGLGYELHARGDDREAVEHLREYIRQQPNGADAAPAYNAMGRALAALGRFDEAADAFRHVLALQPSNDDVHRFLSDVLVRAGNADSLAGRRDAALAKFREAASANPRSSAAETNLGVVLHAMGQLEEARTHYMKAIAIDPNNADAHNDLAHLWASAGRFDLAADEYRQALARRPDWAVARDGLAAAQRQIRPSGR